MTPCEKLGYKVGDRFEVVHSDFSIKIRDILELFLDDGTSEPRFKDQYGNYWWGGIEGSSNRDTCIIVRSLKTSPTIKSGDEITREGKKCRVTLEEIPQYDFKPGMMCRVAWDGTECCSGHTDSDRVVYISHSPHNGRERIAYVAKNGEITLGYVKTTNLRPE